MKDSATHTELRLGLILLICEASEAFLVGIQFPSAPCLVNEER